MSAITDVVHAVTDRPRFFENLLKNGKFEEQFTIINIQETWDEDIVKDHVKLSGSIGFDAKLIVTYQLPTTATKTLEADYGAESGLHFLQEWASEESYDKDLWSGPKSKKIFFIGPVPIEVYWEPKLSLNTKLSASLSASLDLSISAHGSTAMSAIFDGQLKQSFSGPSLEPNYSTNLEVKATVEALVALALTVEMGM